MRSLVTFFLCSFWYILQQIMTGPLPCFNATMVHVMLAVPWVLSMGFCPLSSALGYPRRMPGASCGSC